MEAPRPDGMGEAHIGKLLKHVASKTYVTKIEEVRMQVAVE